MRNFRVFYFVFLVILMLKVEDLDKELRIERSERGGLGACPHEQEIKGFS